MEALFRGQRGDRGAKGDKGDRGEQGLSHRVRYGIVVLFLIGVVIGLCTLGLAIRSVGLADRALAITHHHNALCNAIAELGALPPPPGAASANPSRAFDQREHSILVRLHQQLGCDK
jgi:hypothetical protein